MTSPRPGDTGAVPRVATGGSPVGVVRELGCSVSAGGGPTTVTPKPRPTTNPATASAQEGRFLSRRAGGATPSSMRVTLLDIQVEPYVIGKCCGADTLRR